MTDDAPEFALYSEAVERATALLASGDHRLSLGISHEIGRISLIVGRQFGRKAWRGFARELKMKPAILAFYEREYSEWTRISHADYDP